MLSSDIIARIGKVRFPKRYEVDSQTSGLRLRRLSEDEKCIDVINILPYKSRKENCKRLKFKSFGATQYILEFKSYRDTYDDDITGIIRAYGYTLNNGILTLERPFYREPKEVPLNAAEIYQEVNESWLSGIKFEEEMFDSSGQNVIREGLRHVQSGALHAIAAHWTLSNAPATIIMPTGTGKTEVMIACCVTSYASRLLVVVPTDPLREQVATKFENYGILKKIGVIENLPNPIIGILSSKPTLEHLDQIKKCNIVVTTMHSIGLANDEVQKEFSSLFSHIFFDEAHHIEAKTWKQFRNNSESAKLLLFTATPYRENGNPLDGVIIYNYPLNIAQEKKYFKPIKFLEVFEPDESVADQSIADAAVAQLRNDIANGFDHILMARAETVAKAKKLYENIYSQKFSEYNPVLVHHKSSNKKEILAAIKSGQHKIIVCVSMFGEGFDLPALKIAALHCIHKSLGATLQFIGRFARSSSNENLGTATFVANTADDGVPEALESLYQENADWNDIISDLSFEAIYPQTQLSELVNNLESLEDDNKDIEISSLTLKPKISAQVFRTSEFYPERFKNAFNSKQKIIQSQFNRESNFLILIVNQQDKLEWTDSREIEVDSWDLYLAYYDPSRQLLYIYSSRKKGEATRLAKSISETPELIQGEEVFKVFAGLRRLVLHNVGLSSLSRNVRYQMYAGLDVGSAIDPIQERSKLKSNITGVGYEEGQRKCFGCSRKGKIWSARPGSLALWRSWCDIVGAKLSITDYNENDFLKYTLIPETITSLPNAEVIMVDWPDQLFESSHFRFEVSILSERYGFDECQLVFIDKDNSQNSIRFSLCAGQSKTALLKLKIGESGDNSTANYRVDYISGDEMEILSGNKKYTAADFFTENPPLIRLDDSSQLSGDILLKPQDATCDTFDRDNIETIDWLGNGVAIRQESRWKNGIWHRNSVQQKFIDYLAESDYSFIVDDDDTGESADIVAIKEHEDKIIVYLWHCKYSSEDLPGNRVKDLYEVCGQAQKSIKWTWNLNYLIQHLNKRETYCLHDRPTRFIKGSLTKLNILKRSARRKFVEYQIGIVQPGLSKGNMPTDHLAILGATNSLIQCITNKPLHVYASE